MVNDHRSRAALTWGTPFTPVEPEIRGKALMVMVPHLIVTITSPLALRTWLRTWTIAERYARRVWANGNPGLPPVETLASNRLSVSLHLGGNVGAPVIRATASSAGPGGRLSLTADPIQCNVVHARAWEGLWSTWQHAYWTGGQLWDLPDLAHLAPQWDEWWIRQQAKQRHGL